MIYNFFYNTPSKTLEIRCYLVPPRGIEPRPDDYKSTARPSCYGGKLMPAARIIAEAAVRRILDEVMRGLL